MRPVARIVPFALLPLFLTGAGPLPSATAGAVVDVAMTTSSSFSPASVVVAQGATVRWTNNDDLPHSSKSFQNFWNGPDIGNGGMFSESATFMNAGSYRYFCEVHGSSMSGVVKVRMKKSGSPSNGWTIRWSSLSSNPSNRTFDVKIDRPGTTGYENFKTNVNSRSAFFDPPRTGTYRFKSRTDIGSQSSGFSPVLSVVIS